MMHESDSTSDSHQSISLLSEAVVKQVQLSDSGWVDLRLNALLQINMHRQEPGGRVYVTKSLCG